MYEKFLNNGDIAKILDTINEMHRDELVSCHGRGHALRVVAAAEQILAGLGYDERTVDMGKVAALLHDIGIIAGRRKHAKKSAALAKVFLKTRRQPEHADRATNALKSDFSPEERGIIVQAIANHSEGKRISSAIGAALIIADKIDISRRRIFPLPDLDAMHKNMLEIEDVTLHIFGKTISVSYVGTEKFSPERLTDEYKKGFKLPRRAAEFLGCEYQICTPTFSASS